MLRYTLCFLLLACGFWAAGQSELPRIYKHQLSLTIENDVFTSFFRDQYYSSGLFGSFSWLAKHGEDVKTIRAVTLLQRMYTPQFISYINVNTFDRPYAGHLSAQFSNIQYRKNRVWRQQFELGWMGPGTLTGDIHVSWHNFLGLIEPQGWQYEIQNSPIINYYGTFATLLVGDEKLQLLSETNIAAGTAFNYARQEMILRAGKLLPLLKSIQYNGQLGTDRSDEKNENLQEFIIFYGLSTEYNIYNSTIEGNLIGPHPPHTETPVNWILQHQIGVLLGWEGFDFSFRYYIRSKETTEATFHQYAGVQLSRRY